MNRHCKDWKKIFKVEREGASVFDTKLEEIKDAWKKQHEEEKVNFAEVIRRQVQENTKSTVI